MATPTPAPLPIVQPPAAPAIKPGWQTSEAWLAFLAVVLPALITSGLFAASSETAKIVGLACSVLAALGYGANRTSLKKVHIAAFGAANDNAPDGVVSGTIRQAGFIRPGLMVPLAALLAAGVVASCAWFSSETKKVEQDVIDCTKGDLAGLESIALQIAKGIFAGTISWNDTEQAAITSGVNIGGCILADVGKDIEALVAGSGSGSGSAAKSAAPGAQLALAHFRAALKTSASFKTSDGKTR